MEEATLIWVERGKNPNGFPVETEHRVDIYVEEKSAVRSEHYEAARAGIQINTVLKTRQEDFELSRHLTAAGIPEYATKVLYDGQKYDIERTYKAGKSMIEIVCKEG